MKVSKINLITFFQFSFHYCIVADVNGKFEKTYQVAAGKTIIVTAIYNYI